MKNNSQEFGKWAENEAAQVLVKKGYNILETNWQCGKYEIDIIAGNKDLLIFVEVKARTSNAFGEPEVFVTKQKQRFIIAAAQAYIIEKGLHQEARFDIIGLLKINNNITVKHLEGAFYPSII